MEENEVLEAIDFGQEMEAEREDEILDALERETLSTEEDFSERN